MNKIDRIDRKLKKLQNENGELPLNLTSEIIFLKLGNEWRVIKPSITINDINRKNT